MRWLRLPLTGATAAFRLKVIVLAYLRPEELERTLSSLLDCHFPADTDLAIWIDGPADELRASRVQETINVASAYRWPFGSKSVVSSTTGNHGILHQWANAWNPQGDDEVALFIEEDVEIAPAAPLLLLHHILPAILQDSRTASKRIYGVALQRAQWQLGRSETGRWRRLDLAHHQRGLWPWFGYPAVGTWGQLMLPAPWRRFQAYLIQAAEQETEQVVEGLLTDHWGRARPERRLFSPAFTRFALLHGLVNVYLNGPNGTALAISRLPPGVNFNGNPNVHHRDRLASEAEAQRLVLEALGQPLVEMNHCWDPVVGSVSSMAFVGTARCCLAGRWRKSMANISGLPVLNQTTTALGCWSVEPEVFLEAYSRTQTNYWLVADDGDLSIGTLRTAHGTDWEYLRVPLSAFNGTVRMETPDGHCTHLFCPYAPGKYPDLSLTQRLQTHKVFPDQQADSVFIVE